MQFNTLSTLAWRNLWRNYRRTLIMLAAIAVGVWAMLIMTAMMRGMVEQMISKGISNLPGQIQLHHPQFRDDPSIVNSLSAPNAALLAVLNSQAVTGWSGRVRVPAVISSERDSRGVTLVGLEPATDLGIKAESISSGRFLTSGADRGLVIGAKLAERLETRVGKRVVVMSQDPDNQVADRGFRVVGLFTADFESAEESTIYAGRETLQALLKMGNQLSELTVMGKNHDDLAALTARLAAAAPQLEVLPWTQLDRFLGATVEMMDGFVLVFIIIIFLALSFGLVNTLAMAIFERTREIGLMEALGMQPASVVVQIMIEAFLLLLLGLLLGNLAALGTMHWLDDGLDLSAVAQGMEMMGIGTVLRPAFYIEDLLLADCLVLSLGLLASVIPAWRAAQLNPIQALSRS